MGGLITLSGIDGAGKSTQIERLMVHYAGAGRPLRCLWTRGGYTSIFIWLKDVGRMLSMGALPASGPGTQRERLLKRGWIRNVWLSIAILDLSRVYCLQVRWWRLRRQTVLCDRYLWDTLIDFKLLFPGIEVERWWLWKALIRLAPRPDHAFLLMIPLEESIRRCRQKIEQDPEPLPARQMRYALYQQLARDGHIRVIDAMQSVDAVSIELMDAVGLGDIAHVSKAS